MWANGYLIEAWTKWCHFAQDISECIFSTDNISVSSGLLLFLSRAPRSVSNTPCETVYTIQCKRILLPEGLPFTSPYYIRYWEPQSLLVCNWLGLKLIINFRWGAHVRDYGKFIYRLFAGLNEYDAHWQFGSPSPYDVFFPCANKIQTSFDLLLHQQGSRLPLQIMAWPLKRRYWWTHKL